MRKLLSNSLIKYAMVGVINTIVGLGFTYFFLNVIDFSYWLGTLLGNIIGLICSFILNKTFTFQYQKKILATSLKFIIAFLVCYYIAYGIGNLITDKKNIAVLIGTFIYPIFNYLMQKFFVFKK